MYTATCIFCTCASLGSGVPRRIRPEVYTRRYQKLVRQLRCFFRVRSWPFQGGSPPSFSASPCLPWHHHDPIDRILSGFCCRNAQVQRTCWRRPGLHPGFHAGSKYAVVSCDPHSSGLCLRALAGKRFQRKPVLADFGDIGRLVVDVRPGTFCCLKCHRFRALVGSASLDGGGIGLCWCFASFLPSRVSILQPKTFWGPHTLNILGG